MQLSSLSHGYGGISSPSLISSSVKRRNVRLEYNQVFEIFISCRSHTSASLRQLLDRLISYIIGLDIDSQSKQRINDEIRCKMSGPCHDDVSFDQFLSFLEKFTSIQLVKTKPSFSSSTRFSGSSYENYRSDFRGKAQSASLKCSRITEMLSELVLNAKKDEEELKRIDDLFPTAEKILQEEKKAKRLANIRTLIDARFLPMSNDLQQQVDNLLSTRPTDTVVTMKFNIDISSRKLQCLQPRSWLNDEIINFYMAMLQEREDMLCGNDSQRKKSHYFNSLFMGKLLEGQQYQYSRVKRWSKKVDVFSCRRIFFPINISNSHWTLLVIWMDEKKIVYYDSMSGSGSVYLKSAQQWLSDESLDKKGATFDTSLWTLEVASDVPQQQNGFDCGMFALMCADFLTDDLPLSYSQENMSLFRKLVCGRVINGSLNYPVF